MKSASDTETKDMKYVYVKPYINYQSVGWASIPARSTWYGIYLWNHIFTPKPKETTGKRLLIKNTIDPSGSFLGAAEWVGYAEDVSETQVWIADDVIPVSEWGYHCQNNKMGFGMNHVDPIKNRKNVDRSWVVGIAYQDNYGWPSEPNSTAMKDLKDPFNIYLMNMAINYSTLKNSDMIIWAPETYYCFTEQDVQRDYMFDAKESIPGWTETNTSAEKIYHTITAGAPDKVKNGYNDFPDLFSGCSTTEHAWWQNNIGSNGYSPIGTIYIESRVNYNLYDYGTTVSSGGSARNRQPYTTQGFPYYSINDWKQLYITRNDWAAKLDTSTSNASLITTPAGDKHLSLNAGWPIIAVTKGGEYTYDVSFDDTGDHLVWAKLEPFTTSNANTEIGTVDWDASVAEASGFTNAALVASGETVTLKFTAATDGILYLKWATKPSSGIICKGGGILKPSKTIHEKVVG